MMILAGDIGGTKTLLAIFDGEHCVIKKYFASTQYTTFHTLLYEFLTFIPDINIDAVCIGVAGPIVNGDCETTNLPWKLTCSEISKQVNTPNIKLLNDLEAAAWGVLSLPESDFVSLNPKATPHTGNCAVIAAGTGLGEAMIFHDGNQSHVIASEGGHCDFAPTDKQQIELLEFMQTHFPDHVSYERLVSGAGIEATYNFLKHSGHIDATLNLDAEVDLAAAIGAAAVANTDALCVETMRLFSKIYGAEAGNLALKCLPYGGVYLTGGIATKCLPILQNGAFLDGFLAKGRYRHALGTIAIKVCTQPDVVLFGAAYFAKATSHP